MASTNSFHSKYVYTSLLYQNTRTLSASTVGYISNPRPAEAAVSVRRSCFRRFNTILREMNPLQVTDIFPLHMTLSLQITPYMAGVITCDQNRYLEIVHCNSRYIFTLVWIVRYESIITVSWYWETFHVEIPFIIIMAMALQGTNWAKKWSHFMQVVALNEPKLMNLSWGFEVGWDSWMNVMLVTIYASIVER